MVSGTDCRRAALTCLTPHLLQHHRFVHLIANLFRLRPSRPSRIPQAQIIATDAQATAAAAKAAATSLLRGAQEARDLRGDLALHAAARLAQLPTWQACPQLRSRILVVRVQTLISTVEGLETTDSHCHCHGVAAAALEYTRRWD